MFYLSKRGYRFIKAYKKFNTFVMLQMKVVNFTNEGKRCMMCLDEMSIKRTLFYATTGQNLLIGQKLYKSSILAVKVK